MMKSSRNDDDEMNIKEYVRHVLISLNSGVNTQMFELSKLLLKRLRLWPLATSSVVETTSVLLYFVNLIIELMLLIGSFVYAVQHIQDVDEATETAFVSFAFATTMFIYIWMISKRSAISFSMERLEFYVNESKNGFFPVSITINN